MAFSSLFSSSRLSGELVEFNIQELSTEDDDSLLSIKGRRAGFLYRILEALNLMDTEFSLKFGTMYTVLSSAPTEFLYLPTNELHNFSVSYGKKKLYLVLTVIFFFLSLMITLSWFAASSRESSGILLMMVFSLILTVALNYLYKTSQAMALAIQMISEDRTRTTISIRVKSSLTGQTVEPEYIEQALNSLKLIHQNYGKLRTMKGNSKTATAVSLQK